MSQSFTSNTCKHGFEPRIVCDICFPPLTEAALSAIGKGGKSGGGVIDVYDPEATINCEIDGEQMAGVRYATTRIDRNGNLCLMLFTDPTLAEHVADGYGREGVTAGRL